MNSIHDFYYSRYFKEICWYYGEDHIYIEELGLMEAKRSNNPNMVLSLVKSGNDEYRLNQYNYKGTLIQSYPFQSMRPIQGFAEIEDVLRRFELSSCE